MNVTIPETVTAVLYFGETCDRLRKRNTVAAPMAASTNDSAL
jgi:hypothetical protein